MKNLICVIFLLNIFISIIAQINGLLITPMKKNLNNYYIKIFYDKDKGKSEFVKINMALDFSFIPLSQMVDYKIISENEIIEIDNSEYNTKLISCNNFYFENNSEHNIENFNFYYINKTQLNKEDKYKDNTKYSNIYKGQFGLSPLYAEENENLLNILKQNKLINKMSFGFSFNYKQNNEDILFFGEIEEKNKKFLLNNKKILTKLDLNTKLIKKFNKWGFKLDAVVVEKSTGLTKNIKHKYFAYFNLIEDRIFVPDKIMEYLISRVFNTYIKNKICFVTEYGDKKFINCFKKKINKEKKNFPSIIFVVDNYGFKLAYDDLFINSVNKNEIIFIIQKNYYDIDTSIILFGSRFLKKFTTEFDLEENKISFHSENVIPIINLEKIEDDSWKDIIRDYNQETEHYDSNYGNDKENKDEEEENDNTNNEQSDNDNNYDKKEKENVKNSNDINNDNEKNKKESTNNYNDNNDNQDSYDYNVYIKILLSIFIIIIIIVGIFVFFKERKKIRIKHEKDYFETPFNDNKNEE